MAKVFLINPHSLDCFPSQERRFPLGLLYISSYLKKCGHEALLIDINNFQISAVLDGGVYDLKRYYDDTLKKLILDFKPDILGVTVLFSGRFHPAIDVIRLFKEDHQDIPVAIGGIHPTIFPREIMEEYTCVDYLLQGEGEVSFAELVNTIEKKEYQFDKIDGLCYRVNGKVIVGRKEHYIDDIDKLPFPDYDAIDVKNYYFNTSNWFNPKKLPINTSVYLISSRSCPRKCSFCSMFLVHGRKFRMRSAKNVVDEIEYIYNRFGQHYFSFMDDNLTLNKRRVIEIGDEIIKREINIQFDTPNGLEVNSLDEEVLDTLVRAGLIRTCLAVESGSPRIRKAINKPLKQEKILKVFDIIKKFPELTYNVFFIIGFFEETHETLAETYQLIKQLELKSAMISFAVPYPKTQLFEQCVKNNLIDRDLALNHNFKKFYFFNDTPFFKPYDLEKQDLIDFRLKVYKELNMTKHLKLLGC